jgi:hypothetical protein
MMATATSQEPLVHALAPPVTFDEFVARLGHAFNFIADLFE